MSMPDFSRRDFLKTSGALLGAAMLPAMPGRAMAQANPTAGAKTLRVIQIGIGGIGGMDRRSISRHPKVKIVGLVDVDQEALDKVGAQFPDAFREKDYRKVFADRLGEFDAVNICTPDLSHINPLLLSLTNNKHVYGQKPLVQQLEELDFLASAVKSRPHLATQTGNQRMQSTGRRIAVDILERGLLGKAISAHAWAGTVRGSAKPIELPPAMEAPANIDWDLWLGPAQMQPYREGIAPNKWRAWWEFGTAGMGDWGVHLLDLIMYSYPELTSPISVKCDTPRAANWYHTADCKSTITYAVNSDKFKNDTYKVYYNDSGISPNLRELGIPKDKAGSNNTVFVCEGGTLFIDANGDHLEIYSKNKPVTPKELGANEDVGEYKHWDSWIDKALGDEKVRVWTPFEQGLRMTECAILPVKASRFPGQELKWDRKTLTFTNSQEATDTVVRRAYRDGFAPPRFA